MIFKKKIQEKKESIKKNILEKEKLLTVIDYFTDGILIFNKANELSLINPQAEQIFGVEKRKVMGLLILKLSRFPKFKPLVSLLGGGIDEVLKRELKIKENLILEVTSTTIMDQEERIGNLVVLHDITREKLVEKMKTEFVTLAAHQLRTPTSGIKWSLRMLLDGDSGEIPEKQKEVIRKAYQSNDKVIALINDLLNVSKIEEGKLLSKMALVDINEVVQSAIDTIKEESEKKNLKIEFKKTKEKLPRAMVDVKKMEMAISNLLDNAARYTMAGGKISIFTKVIEKKNSKEKEIEIEIKDTGLGIPEYQQKEIFSKFFRGENVIKVETEGTGLGLYISKNIIEAHGGRIWFESAEGQGTTFYIALPVKERFTEYVGKEFY